ncbi:hypothetical protein LF1_36150 [Rubripirellula obstinata]|uniref:Cytochrome c-552/4 domain-containing protein n=2 Tax=Rubripirellula obstinata TaxID=406547 RepID=A0A5B1CL91_9BACT|nr:hypothetical protein [Rubripirellula obstinata]KAA1261071.1 hypothetical protein LF1_36150 [Rubripirellula obstinata]
MMRRTVAIVFFAMLTVVAVGTGTAAERAEARSDGDARYLHHIDLYDTDNRKITAESTLPYSPRNTCGRCHDYNTISHGWHFNAFDSTAISGRDGEPWIWTDARTGTQLPLTYRDWSHSFHPSQAGLSPWQMTLKFGGRLPGGGPGENGSVGDIETGQEEQVAEIDPPRWQLSGSLEVDCLACHAVSGAYDMNERRSQIEKQNFAWAPTAALRLGEIKGDVSRIRGKIDPADESVQKKMPTVTYDARKFALDGSVFVDLVRQPLSNACYQCHSQRTVDEQGVQQRWIHDEDVHLRAGMDCVDCHRNGLDHDMVRGFEGQQHSNPDAMVTLSCAGCHLGQEGSSDPALLAGRLGSPKPLHEGLPPIHFEKLACTACHSGPMIDEQAQRLMTSLAHSLGEKGRRKGDELPAMVSGVYTKRADDKVYPHKAMWPAYWGVLNGDDSITPLNPDQVYDWTRKTLRVRRDFIDELMLPKLKSDQRKEVLGEERARVDSEEWNQQEQDLIGKRQQEIGQQNFREKVSASLKAIEKEIGDRTAVYVSTGQVYAVDSEGTDSEGTGLREIESSNERDTGMITWPMAHNVRPAGRSLGVGGCVECHSDDGLIFASTVSPVGPVNRIANDSDGKVTMASLQGVDPLQRLAWNQMFSGRKTFKYFIAGSIAILVCVLMIGLGMLSVHLFHKAELKNNPLASSDSSTPSQEARR